MCPIYVKVIEDAEYSDLRPTFSPLFHVICLIYSNSKYYSTQARIIVILKVCCNSSYIRMYVCMYIGHTPQWQWSCNKIRNCQAQVQSHPRTNP